MLRPNVFLTGPNFTAKSGDGKLFISPTAILILSMKIQQNAG
jgi:hypothetical protein